MISGLKLDSLFFTPKSRQHPIEERNFPLFFSHLILIKICQVIFVGVFETKKSFAGFFSFLLEFFFLCVLQEKYKKKLWRFFFLFFSPPQILCWNFNNGVQFTVLVSKNLYFFSRDSWFQNSRAGFFCFSSGFSSFWKRKLKKEIWECREENTKKHRQIENEKEKQKESSESAQTESRIRAYFVVCKVHHGIVR